MDQEKVRIYVISDESEGESLSSQSRPGTDEQDPHEGKRVLRKKQPIDKQNDSKPGTSDKKGFTRGKKQKLETHHEEPQPGYILTTLEGVAFQSRLPQDEMTTAENVAFPEVDRRIYLDIRNRVLQVIIYTSIGMIPI